MQLRSALRNGKTIDWHFLRFMVERQLEPAREHCAKHEAYVLSRCRVTCSRHDVVKVRGTGWREEQIPEMGIGARYSCIRYLIGLTDDPQQGNVSEIDSGGSI